MQQINTKYEFLTVIGQGSYGVVYKCKDKSTGELVAIKRFKESDDAMLRKMVARELRIVQMIKHANIVGYKECFRRKGDLYVVFEYVEENLIQLLERIQKLGEDDVKSIIFQLCQAMYYLNSNGIVHRDIKPENLLILKDEEGYKLKLCDFGFAKKYHYLRFIKEVMTDYVATRWYRAPELIIANGDYGYEIDYWGIGCIMAEMIDGDPLFPGNNDLDQLMTIQKVLGKFPQDFYDLFENLSPYINKETLQSADIQEFSSSETLKKKLFEKLSDQGNDFLNCLLQVNPRKRLKGLDVLHHPYFYSLNKNNQWVDNENEYATNIIKTETNFKSSNLFEAILKEKKISLNTLSSSTPKNYHFKTGNFFLKSKLKLEPVILTSHKDLSKHKSEPKISNYCNTLSNFFVAHENKSKALYYSPDKTFKLNTTSGIKNFSLVKNEKILINKEDFRKVKKFFTSTLFTKDKEEDKNKNKLKEQIDNYYNQEQNLNKGKSNFFTLNHVLPLIKK